MEILNNTEVKLGTPIANYKDSYVLGDGVYLNNKQLIASTYGTVSMTKYKNQQGKEMTKISVINSITNKSVSLKPNDILYGKVYKIREDGVWVRVIQINETMVPQHIEGLIKREYVREKEIDAIKMHECFIPGDIVKTKFISFGDGRKLYLSTVGQDLGVVYAKSQTSGKLMLPFSWTEMICLKSGVKEKRKVCKP